MTLRPEIPVPAIFVASTTPLAQFQDAIEAQWRFRPDVVLNTYAIARNEIYLYDGAAYFAQRNRTLDDSLAHEFVHYLQAQYRTMTLGVARGRAVDSRRGSGRSRRAQHASSCDSGRTTCTRGARRPAR